MKLSEEKRKRITQLNLDIARIAKEATTNINEDKSRISVDMKELINLQNEALAQLKPADEPGHVWLPLKSP